MDFAALWPTDLLWKAAMAGILPAILAAILCRLLPCRPATRHTIWMTVLLLFVLPVVFPRRSEPAVLSRERSASSTTRDIAPISRSDETLTKNHPIGASAHREALLDAIQRRAAHVAPRTESAENPCVPCAEPATADGFALSIKCPRKRRVNSPDKASLAEFKAPLLDGRLPVHVRPQTGGSVLPRVPEVAKDGSVAKNSPPAMATGSAGRVGGYAARTESRAPDERLARVPGSVEQLFDENPAASRHHGMELPVLAFGTKVQGRAQPILESDDHKLECGRAFSPGRKPSRSPGRLKDGKRSSNPDELRALARTVRRYNGNDDYRTVDCVSLGGSGLRNAIGRQPIEFVLPKRADAPAPHGGDAAYQTAAMASRTEKQRTDAAAFVEDDRTTAIADEAEIHGEHESTPRAPIEESPLVFAGREQELQVPAETWSARGAWRPWIAGLANVRRALVDLPPIPASVWLGGCAMLLVIGCGQILAFRRLLSRAVPAPPDILAIVKNAATQLGLRGHPETLVMDSRISPMIWCGRKVRLILPTGLWAQLDDAGRRAVVFHELAHLKRRDHWVCWAEKVVGLLYWWHPLVWWIRHRIQDEADLCCDAWVTWLIPGERRAYAEALLRAKQYVGNGSLLMPAVGMGVTTARARQFARRLTMVMTRRVRPRLSGPGMALAVALATAGWLASPAQSCPDAKVSEGAEAPAAPVMAFAAAPVAPVPMVAPVAEVHPVPPVPPIAPTPGVHAFVHPMGPGPEFVFAGPHGRAFQFHSHGPLGRGAPWAIGFADGAWGCGKCGVGAAPCEKCRALGQGGPRKGGKCYTTCCKGCCQDGKGYTKCCPQCQSLGKGGAKGLCKRCADRGPCPNCPDCPKARAGCKGCDKPCDECRLCARCCEKRVKVGKAAKVAKAGCKACGKSAPRRRADRGPGPGGPFGLGSHGPGAAPSADAMRKTLEEMQVQLDRMRERMQEHGARMEERIRDRIERRIERAERQADRARRVFESRSAGPTPAPPAPPPPAPRALRMERRDGASISKVYRLPEGKREALTSLMARSDVPIMIRPHEKGIEVIGTRREHRIFQAFVRLIHPESSQGVPDIDDDDDDDDDSDDEDDNGEEAPPARGVERESRFHPFRVDDHALALAEAMAALPDSIEDIELPEGLQEEIGEDVAEAVQEAMEGIADAFDEIDIEFDEDDAEELAALIASGATLAQDQVGGWLGSAQVIMDQAAASLETQARAIEARARELQSHIQALQREAQLLEEQAEQRNRRQEDKRRKQREAEGAQDDHQSSEYANGAHMLTWVTNLHDRAATAQSRALEVKQGAEAMKLRADAFRAWAEAIRDAARFLREESLASSRKE